METLPKLKRFAAVEVRWIDANSSDGWTSVQEYEEWKKEKLEVHTIGYFLDADDTFLRICFGFAEWDGAPKFTINPFAIPLVCVKSVRSL